MIKRTHLAGGLLAASIAYAYGDNQTLVYVTSGTGVALFGSLIPDIDHSGSTLGKKVPWVGKVLKHRGFTHSALFVLINYILVSNIITAVNIKYSINISWLMWYVYGIISHIILDLLNYAGLQLLYPFKDKFSLPIIKISTGKGGDMAVGILCIMMAISIFINPNIFSNSYDYIAGLISSKITINR